MSAWAASPGLPRRASPPVVRGGRPVAPLGLRDPERVDGLIQRTRIHGFEPHAERRQGLARDALRFRLHKGLESCPGIVGGVAGVEKREGSAVLAAGRLRLPEIFQDPGSPIREIRRRRVELGGPLQHGAGPVEVAEQNGLRRTRGELGGLAPGLGAGDDRRVERAALVLSRARVVPLERELLGGGGRGTERQGERSEAPPEGAERRAMRVPGGHVTTSRCDRTRNVLRAWQGDASTSKNTALKSDTE